MVFDIFDEFPSSDIVLRGRLGEIIFGSMDFGDIVYFSGLDKTFIFAFE